jgi:hypothetical protein
MSGVKGQQGTGAKEVPAKFEEGFLATMDGRGRTVRTLRQRLGALISDLGGAAGLSYQEQSLCKRLVHLERLIERKESTLAHGGNVEETNYLSAINALTGLCGKLGLKRRAKPVLSLSDYLAKSKPAAEPTTTNAPTPTTDGAQTPINITTPQPKENEHVHEPSQH